MPFRITGISRRIIPAVTHDHLGVGMRRRVLVIAWPPNQARNGSGWLAPPSVLSFLLAFGKSGR